MTWQHSNNYKPTSSGQIEIIVECLSSYCAAKNKPVTILVDKGERVDWLRCVSCNQTRIVWLRNQDL